jgi:glycosyltransferase involved in cell wall biosynthesis
MGVLQTWKPRFVSILMKVLIVARCKNGQYAPFIMEQVLALQGLGVECHFFPVTKRGLWGYLRHLNLLRRTIRSTRPDLIHAHYGLSGLLANLQRQVPVVTTYHGSDINDWRVRPLSRLSIRLSSFNIFVSRKTMDIISPENKYALIPCGVNLDDYPGMNKDQARLQMNLDPEGEYILFSGAFDNPVKNASLAQSAVSLIGDKPSLIELKGYSRSQVAALMYAADVLIMTSHTEGSPQVIKEALTCGCPIVSVDVGDVAELLSGLEGCFLVREASAPTLAEALKTALSFRGRTTGRERIVERGLTNDRIARQLMRIYQSLV